MQEKGKGVGSDSIKGRIALLERGRAATRENPVWL